MDCYHQSRLCIWSLGLKTPGGYTCFGVNKHTATHIRSEYRHVHVYVRVCMAHCSGSGRLKQNLHHPKKWLLVPPSCPTNVANSVRALKEPVPGPVQPIDGWGHRSIASTMDTCPSPFHPRVRAVPLCSVGDILEAQMER